MKKVKKSAIRLETLVTENPKYVLVILPCAPANETKVILNWKPDLHRLINDTTGVINFHNTWKDYFYELKYLLKSPSPKDDIYIIADGENVIWDNPS